MIFLTPAKLTPALAQWIAQASDRRRRGLVAGAPRLPESPLQASQRAGAIEVTHADGAPLSAYEEREIRALLAAHAKEPLKPL